MLHDRRFSKERRLEMLWYPVQRRNRDHHPAVVAMRTGRWVVTGWDGMGWERWNKVVVVRGSTIHQRNTDAAPARLSGGTSNLQLLHRTGALGT